MSKAQYHDHGIDSIVVKGARTHNLKNINVEMPRNKMVVFTGLSGSGKSSLAFDTIFAEGQRRYVESLSSYARQFLRQMQKPDVDEITGLSPAISIDQKSRSNNPRSTVATITEIYDYLRILYARIGMPHCLVCGSAIKKLSNEEIKNFVLEKVDSSSSHHADFIEIFSPLVRGRKGEYYQLLYDLLGKGYSEVLIDGNRKKLREQIELTKNKRHDIAVLVDRIRIDDFKNDAQSSLERLSESLEKALDESEGLIRIILSNTTKQVKEKIEASDKPELAGALSPVILETKDLTIKEDFLMSSKFSCPKDGYSYPEIEPRLFSFNSPYGACPECNGLGTQQFFGEEPCTKCKGARLREEALHVTIGGKNIVDFTALSISDSEVFLEGLKLTVTEKNIAKVILKEIESRLTFMINVGIEYLSLNRRAHTLSGGEAQRIRLASQLGSGLVGALYVLDEPTIGLHSRDNDRLIKTLVDLRDAGNSILIVEHDEDTIYASDYIIDIGPGAGIHGGKIVVADYLEPLLTAKTNTSESLTLDYLRGERKIEVPKTRRDKDKGKIMIRGANIFNLKNINVDIPLGKLVLVTGVSGSGKSSLVYEVIYKNLQARLERRHRTNDVYNCASFSGSEYLGRVVLIDQSPIGRTPRSNPMTYTGAWSFVRELFAESAEARVRGWKANRFSFNVK